MDDRINPLRMEVRAYETSLTLQLLEVGLCTINQTKPIKVITKLPNSEQSYKGKVKTHNYKNRQNQSTAISLRRT